MGIQWELRGSALEGGWILGAAEEVGVQRSRVLRANVGGELVGGRSVERLLRVGAGSVETLLLAGLLESVGGSD